MLRIGRIAPPQYTMSITPLRLSSVVKAVFLRTYGHDDRRIRLGYCFPNTSVGRFARGSCYNLLVVQEEDHSTRFTVGILMRPVTDLDDAMRQEGR